jgi:hypothetical protein
MKGCAEGIDDQSSRKENEGETEQSARRWPGEKRQIHKPGENQRVQWITC